MMVFWVYWVYKWRLCKTPVISRHDLSHSLLQMSVPHLTQMTSSCVNWGFLVLLTSLLLLARFCFGLLRHCLTVFCPGVQHGWPRDRATWSQLRYVPLLPARTSQIMYFFCPLHLGLRENKTHYLFNVHFNCNDLLRGQLEAIFHCISLWSTCSKKLHVKVMDFTKCPLHLSKHQTLPYSSAVRDKTLTTTK